MRKCWKAVERSDQRTESRLPAQSASGGLGVAQTRPVRSFGLTLVLLLAREGFHLSHQPAEIRAFALFHGAIYHLLVFGIEFGGLGGVGRVIGNSRDDAVSLFSTTLLADDVVCNLSDGKKLIRDAATSPATVSVDRHGVC